MHPSAVGRFIGGEDLMVDEGPPLDGPQLLPTFVKTAVRRRTHQPLDTAVDGVVVALFPGGAKPCRQVVGLEDVRLVAVHAGVTTGDQPRYPAPDDADSSRSFSLRHVNPLSTRI